MTEIAHGEINVDLDDAAAIAGLRHLEAQFAASMAAIDRMKAEANVDADTHELNAKLKMAKDEVRALRGIKATVKLAADKKELDTAILSAQQQVKRLDGQKATIEIGTRGREGELALARTHVKVTKLKNEYSKLTDVIEELDRRQRKTIGSETRMKIDVERGEALAKFAAVKKELEFLGGHPPVNIKIDTDRNDANRLRRYMRGLGHQLGNVFDKASSIGNLRLNLGPFSGTIKTFTTAALALSPLLVSLGGSLTSLVGVLGTGLVGASAVGAGALTGLALNIGGVVGALRPAIADFKLASAATEGYTKAVAKYGASSKQAQSAQDKMNHVLKSVDPNVRKAAQSMAKARVEWDRLTASTAKRDLGKVLAGGFQALNTLMPTFARNTNVTMDLLTTKFTGFTKALSTPAAVNIFDSLGQSANAFLGPALDGIGSLAGAFGRVAESAARIFGGAAGQGFAKWAANIAAATQSGAGLDATITRLGNHAADLLHFFAALGRVMTTVLNGGANAGDGLLHSMTGALNKWNAFLKSARGQRSMADFFDRAADGARAMWHALAPLVASFVTWASLLTPVTSGMLEAFSAISRLVSGFTRLVGMGGTLGALGATIGTIFAVGKIGAFVAYLARAVALMKTLGAIGTLKSIVGGGFLGQLRSPAAGMAQGGAVAGAEIRSAMIQGGAAAAAEIRGAMITGGLAGGAGGIAGGAKGLAGKVLPGAAAGAGVSGLAGGASAATTGILGMSAAATTAAAVALPLLGIGALLVADDMLKGESAAEKLEKRIKSQKAAVLEDRNAFNSHTDALGKNIDSVKESHSALRAAREELKHTTDGTMDHRDAELKLFDARQKDKEAIQERRQNAREQHAAAGQEIADQRRVIASTKERHKARIEDLRDQLQAPKPGGMKDSVFEARQAGILKQLDKALAQQAIETASAERRLTQALNERAAATLNLARAGRNLKPVTGKDAQSLGSLSRRSPAVAQTIALKFTSPADVGKAARAATSALKAGVPKSMVVKILADAKNATQAVKALETKRIKALMLKVGISGDNGVLSRLSTLDAKKIRAKIARIIEHGGRPTLAMIQEIIMKQIRDKPFAVRADVNQALGGVGSVIAAIARLPSSKNISITTTHYNKSVNQSPGGDRQQAGGKTTAQGGIMPPEQKAMNAAAWGPVSSQQTTGGKYQTPTFLVGEESRPEFVIATNPAYREPNIRYLKQAAQALGVQMAAGGYSPLQERNQGIGNPGYYPTQFIPREPEKMAMGKRKKALEEKFGRNLNLLSASPAAKYVKSLQVKEQDLQSEIELQQRQVREPDTFLRATGNKITLDDGSVVDEFVIDDNAVRQYKDQLGRVAGWQANLTSTIAEEIKYLPRAMKELHEIRVRARENLKLLKKEKTRLEKAIEKERAKKHTSQKAVNAFRKRLQTVNNEIKREEKLRSDAAEDEGTLGTREREAGFDYRSAQLDLSDTNRDIEAVGGRAAEELKQGGPSGGGSSGGGTSSTDSDLTAQATQQRDVAQAQLAASQNFIKTLLSPGDIGEGMFGVAMGAAVAQRAIGAAALGPGGGGGAFGSPARQPGSYAAAGSGQQPTASAAGGQGSAWGTPPPSTGDGINLTVNVNALTGADPRVAAEVRRVVSSAIDSGSFRRTGTERILGG